LTLLFLSSFSLNAQHKSTEGMFDIIQKSKVPAEHASQFGALPMQSSDGRMEPINTFSSEVLRKLHRAEKIGDLNSDQFLLSLLTITEMWKHVPLIALSNKKIAFNYDITEGYCSYAELFDSNGQYKLHKDLEVVYKKTPSE